MVVHVFDNLEDIFQSWRNFNENSKAIVTLATAIGTVTILILFFKLIYSSIIGLRLYVISQYCCSRKFLEKYGQWVVISGSTDGIGLGMAKELARDGHSIIVIGRNEEKLANAKTALEEEANVGEVLTVKIDLSDSSLENFENIRRQIDPDNRDIGILINNAGTFSDSLKRFNRFDMDEVRRTVNINVLATLHLTRMIMPGMINRGKGLVMNVSSILGSIPSPYMGIYGPTKDFIDKFSQNLQIEYSSHPIDIINLAPGPVHTKLFKGTSKIAHPSLVNPSPEDYARTSLNAASAGINSYTGTPTHGFVSIFSRFIDSLGLIPFTMKINIKFNARNYQISPVMKRRKVSQGETTVPSDEQIDVTS